MQLANHHCIRCRPHAVWTPQTDGSAPFLTREYVFVCRMSSVAPEGKVEIKARKKHESTLELPPGSAIHWEFRLHSKDIGFSARFERETESGKVEEEQVRLAHPSLSTSTFLF